MQYPNLALGISVVAVSFAAMAAEHPVGRDNVLGLVGCFDVTYRFYEDGEHDYFNDKYGLETSIQEVISLIEDQPNRVTVQHASINDEGVPVPHWHETWVYSALGWTQTVYSRTPDNPDRKQRYSCTAPWSGNRWQCDAGRATKPFRDDGAPFGFMRTDYTWLDRNNTILVTPKGWVQSEHNRKLDGNGTMVSHELGFITYRKLNDSECQRDITSKPSSGPNE
jgi:hypothetical protein